MESHFDFSLTYNLFESENVLSGNLFFVHVSLLYWEQVLVFFDVVIVLISEWKIEVVEEIISNLLSLVLDDVTREFLLGCFFVFEK